VLIDAATLHDLDVLTPSTPRGRTLWSLVDRTRSRAGREHLRQRLVAPDHTAAAIVERQRAHQALARDLGGYGRLLDALGADASTDTSTRRGSSRGRSRRSPASARGGRPGSGSTWGPSTMGRRASSPRSMPRPRCGIGSRPPMPHCCETLRTR